MALSDWIEVFAAGTWTASNGTTSTWSEEDLHKIANKYNEQYPSRIAPAVLGHPKNNAPAYGWVERLKVEGGKLLARFKDFQPQFVDWVRQGLYKFRSISLGPDLELRHVGWLGGVQPAVPGLKEVSLNADDDVIVIEFANDDKPGNNASQHQSEENEYMDPNNPGGAAAGGTDDRIGRLESTVNQLVQTVTDLVRRTATPAPPNNHAENDDDHSSNDDERIATLLEQNTQAYSRIARLERETLLSQFREFMNTPEMRKRVAPADRQERIDTLVMMADIDREKNFSEGDDRSMVEKYKKELLKLPEIVIEGEFATADRAADQVNTRTGFTMSDKDAPDLGRREKLLKAQEYAQKNDVDLTSAIYITMRQEA